MIDRRIEAELEACFQRLGLAQAIVIFRDGDDCRCAAFADDRPENKIACALMHALVGNLLDEKREFIISETRRQLASRN